MSDQLILLIQAWLLFHFVDSSKVLKWFIMLNLIRRFKHGFIFQEMQPLLTSLSSVCVCFLSLLIVRLLLPVFVYSVLLQGLHGSQSDNMTYK